MLCTAIACGAAYAGWGSAASGTGDPETRLHASEPHFPGRMPASRSAKNHATHPVGSPVAPAQTASPAASDIESERPVDITLPSGAQMRVLPAATDTSGVLQVPADIGLAGWWDGSSRIGDPFGSIVVAAHVDSFTQGIGKFAELLAMHPGDAVLMDSAHLRQKFVVVSAHLEPKTSLATDARVFAPAGDGRLVLLTCGGTYDPDLGGYQDNMVVVATPHGAPTRLP